MNAKAFSSVAQGSTGDVMPWGKHKGTPLDQVPGDYLNWAVRNADHLRGLGNAVVPQVAEFIGRQILLYGA